MRACFRINSGIQELSATIKRKLISLSVSTICDLTSTLKFSYIQLGALDNVLENGLTSDRRIKYVLPLLFFFKHTRYFKILVFISHNIFTF